MMLGQLYEIFFPFAINRERSILFMSENNWEIVIFKPFIRSDLTNFPFRIYGKVRGSIFKKYNDHLQLYGGVDYLLNNTTKEFTRKEWINKIHPSVILEVDFHEIANKI